MLYPVPTRIEKSPGRICGILVMLTTLVVSALMSPDAVAEVPSLVTLELAWDPVPELDVIGYRVHIGTSSGQYPRIEETGTDASYLVTELERGVTYYFAVSAFNDQGLEGALSDELVVIIDTPPLPMEVGITTDSTGVAQVLRWSFPQSALGSSPEVVIQQSTDLVTWTGVAVVGADEYHAKEGGNVIFEWPVPIGDRGSMFYRLTARNWLGDSITP